MATVLVLRTSDKNGRSHGGFQWPASGPVECPDWNPRRECGNGLHGLLWGEGNASLMSSEHDALWQVVEVVAETIVPLDGKVKFPRGTVVYSGARQGALQMVLRSKQRLAEIRAIAETGDGGSVATTKLRAHSSTAGDYAHSSTAGDYAHSSTAGNSAHSSTAGNYAHSSTAGDYAHSSTAGANSIAAALGPNSRVRAAEKGVIVASYWHEKQQRIRVLVGHIGEDGLTPNTWYEVKVLANGTAKWKAVKA